MPAAHSVQVMDAENEAKEPAEHMVHIIADNGEYEPDVHCPDCAERPDVAQYEPEIQDSQSAEPATGWKVPGGQLEHVIDPTNA